MRTARISRALIFACLLAVAAPPGMAQSPRPARPPDDRSPAAAPDLTAPQSFPSPSSDAAAEPLPLPYESEIHSAFPSADLTLPPVCESCLPDPPATKYPTVRVTGFFHADAGYFFQDDASKLTAADYNTSGDIDDAWGFRRARLAATGDVASNVGYMIEFDFAFAGRPSFMDVWLELRDLDTVGNLRIGQFRQPNSMEALTSIRELPFLERSLSFALVPFRQTGAMIYDHNEDETVTWAGSFYKYQVDAYGDNFGDRGYGGAGRLTGLLYYDEQANSVIHVGGSYSYNAPSNNTLRFRTPPEFAGVNPDFTRVVNPIYSAFLVDTGPLAANGYHLTGLEFAGANGPLYFESELRYAAVNLLNGGTAIFPGFYGQFAYILTGEHRPYKRTAGVFGRIVPDHPFERGGGCGAWEAAVRYSYLDLNDSGVDGGRLSDVTLGLNWYLNRFTKFQFNWIHALANHPIFGDSCTEVAAVRAQLDF